MFDLNYEFIENYRKFLLKNINDERYVNMS